MQQSGDWLDRTMAFLLGLLGTFFGLAIVWALIETLTPLRLHLGGSRGAVAAMMGAISLAVAIWQGRRAGRHSTSPQAAVSVLTAQVGVRAPTAEDRAMAEAMIAGITEQVRHEAELDEGTWPVPLAVRLAPQIPIRDQKAPRN